MPVTSSGGISPARSLVICNAAIMKRGFFIIVCAGTALLFAAAGNWMWQMARLARESAEMVKAVRVQIETIGVAVTNVSAKLVRLESEVSKVGTWFGPDRPRSPSADADIENLLNKLRDADVAWASEEGEKPRLLLYGIVLAKYQLMKGSVTTPGEFIDKVANADLLGKPLNVLEPDGTRRSLQDWFRRQ